MDMDKIYYPYKATDKKHKYFIITSTGKKVRFWSSKNKDYTIYYQELGKYIADKKRKAYINCDSKLNENWSESGIDTAGWRSRYLLWEYPTIDEAYQHREKRLKSIGIL